MITNKEAHLIARKYVKPRNSF